MFLVITFSLLKAPFDIFVYNLDFLCFKMLNTGSPMSKEKLINDKKEIQENLGNETRLNQRKRTYEEDTRSITATPTYDRICSELGFDRYNRTENWAFWIFAYNEHLNIFGCELLTFAVLKDKIEQEKKNKYQKIA